MRTRFWKWTTQARPHWRSSYKEAAILFTVFGVTGSSSMLLVRPVLSSVTGIEGSWRDGPWSYRVSTALLISPVYACILITVGTAAGRHNYFAAMAKGILGRFLPKPVMARCPASPPSTRV